MTAYPGPRTIRTAKRWLRVIRAEAISATTRYDEGEFDNLNRKTLRFESACSACRLVVEPSHAIARFQCMGNPRIVQGMAKPRIVVTCPQTGVTVISNIAYDDIAGPGKKSVFFACACGETHKLIFAGRHGDLGKSPISTIDSNQAS